MAKSLLRNHPYALLHRYQVIRVQAVLPTGRISA